jgi:hypothetical protein
VTIVILHGDWIAERAQRGLPANAPAPEGYESEAGWFKRVRGLAPRRAAVRSQIRTFPIRPPYGQRSQLRHPPLAHFLACRDLCAARSRGLGRSLPFRGVRKCASWRHTRIRSFLDSAPRNRRGQGIREAAKGTRKTPAEPG